MDIFFQAHYKEYSGVPTPEKPERIDWIKSCVEGRVVKENAEGKKAILSVIGEEKYEEFLSLCRREAKLPDNPFESSLPLVVENAIATAIEAGKNKGFAVIRPPGHHASLNRFAGFCYFNNLFIVCEYLFHGKRIAILDIDAHYGDGTHELIAEKENYFYVSIHANPRYFYPFRKLESKNSLLIDVMPMEVDDTIYVSLVKEALKKIEEFKPEIIAVSAGFDTYYKDPVLGFAISDVHTYREVGRVIADAFKDVHTFALLEGGYHPQLGTVVKNFVEGMNT